jgi:hypothetical protein
MFPMLFNRTAAKQEQNSKKPAQLITEKEQEIFQSK